MLLFISMDIYARTYTHILLKDGIVPQIGYTTASKSYKKDGTCEPQLKLVFDLENNGHEDVFVFEDEKLVFNAISLHTGAYMTDTYQELIERENVSIKSFIEEIREKFVLTAMGLLD